jgi:CheY-like chemotaxis protein
VVLTAHALEGDRELGLASSMDDHLGKLFTIKRLEAILERWLQSRGDHPILALSPLALKEKQ